MRVLTLGDSITAAGGWQSELSRLCALVGVTLDVRNVAVPGKRTDYWPDKIAALLTQHDPDLVTLFSGTNDDPYDPIYGEPKTAWSFRSVVEAVHGYRPANPPKLAVGLIQYSDPLIAPDWLLRNEPMTNDTLWTQMQHYLPQGWFVGIANFQQIPSTADYLDAGGIHPNAFGYRTMGRIVYDAIHDGMGWPACSEPPLCGMHGHRKGYPRPAYTPCSWTGG
jgi:lysophospholipase L1-like esterase